MKRKLKKGQIIGICAVVLLMLLVAALLCYDFFILKKVEKDHIVSAVLITASLIVTIIRLLSQGGRSGTGKANRKKIYREAYGEHIRDAFADNKKAEELMYDIFEDYNKGNYAKALDKLEKLSKEIKNANERYTVAFCRAISLDSLGLYEKAIEQYELALTVRVNGTVYSNMGICFSELGKMTDAIDAYTLALEIAPENPAPYANLASLYIREANYEKALNYAQKANALDSKYPTALGAQAICYAMLENDEKYREYYQRAAAVGYNVARLNQYIFSLKNSLS